ncbi:HTH-type transcriptional regulator CysL [Pseudoruegeria aquimaris]|uniref:HTH-type transcriptional regulator CysL n=1 Tax=Pseudoruegeria aquimaris TaxID=393663 RepID=A0A1Y5TKI4_9RHOB|nr:LysR family transcriptional regulator [Pseudoruegeria aquimaris]SLN66116.1 HTH-type transcriptional regulator CysL [Pseudoruegeria aquimaris]
MLNATWLETFTTLCETGHFTEAAARLNMTQPGVSQHLRKLEAQLGTALISRDGKRFTLTPAGEEVRAVGLERRAQEQRLRQAIEGDDRDRGRLHIACSGSFALLLFPALLPWMAAAPQLDLRLEAAPQGTIRDGVLDGRFDLGVLDADPRQPRFTARRLGREELCLLLPAGAEEGGEGGAEEAITMEALQARGLIAHPDVFSYADDLLQLNFPDTYPGAEALRLRGQVNQIGQILAPVAAGVGYTMLPHSGVRSFEGRGRLRRVELPRRRWHDLWLVHRRGRVLSARLSHAAVLIAEVAARLR